ncbi:DUF7919 family protein [Cellulomonas xiejunii]|uniref:DUF7919 family protein n=1 Tax=Cellulomonas xiejunii TaxID=2968083 RepID=UPI001D0E458E|nr:hypothetical protein [Cellulomonas xiejunii]MCC2315848.1 hypothetical protein [Cellulomonas xiejunii]
MSFYEDLSAYEYTPVDVPMKNIGWLAPPHPFPTGDSPGWLVSALLLLAEDLECVMRGVHDCAYCEVESPVRFRSGPGGRVVSVGTGEIRVEGQDGRRYAAPSLVVHYVAAHRYRPPQDFIDAVDTARGRFAHVELPGGTSSDRRDIE